MSNPTFPAVFYKFARGMVDLTRDYDSTNKEIVLVALDNLASDNRLQSLRELRIVFAELADRRYAKSFLIDVLWHSGARVVPRNPVKFFEEALPILDSYIAKGGAPRRWNEDE